MMITFKMYFFLFKKNNGINTMDIVTTLEAKNFLGLNPR